MWGAYLYIWSTIGKYKAKGGLILGGKGGTPTGDRNEEIVKIQVEASYCAQGIPVFFVGLRKHNVPRGVLLWVVWVALGEQNCKAGTIGRDSRGCENTEIRLQHNKKQLMVR